MNEESTEEEDHVDDEMLLDDDVVEEEMSLFATASIAAASAPGSQYQNETDDGTEGYGCYDGDNDVDSDTEEQEKKQDVVNIIKKKKKKKRKTDIDSDSRRQTTTDRTARDEETETSMTGTRELASTVEQTLFHQIVALWTALSLRPFKIVEDPMLQEAIDACNNTTLLNRKLTHWIIFSARPIDIAEDPMLKIMLKFASIARGRLLLPSTIINTTNVLDGYEALKVKVLKDIEDHCHYFACTLDVWTCEAVMQSFLAIKLHYLSEDFQWQMYTLDVKLLFRNDNRAWAIRQEIEQSFSKWNLNASMLSMTLRSSTSSMVSACNDCGMKHFPSIGHCLHLIVAPFLVKRDVQYDFERCINDETEEDVENEYHVFNDEFGNDFGPRSAVHDEEILSEVRTIVYEYRRLYWFFKNNPNCFHTLSLNQNVHVMFPLDKNRTAKNEALTRWSTTLEMLSRMIQYIDPINQFLSFYNSPEGKSAFEDSRIILKPITEEQWAILQGLCYLLAPFKIDVESLSSQSDHLLYSSALPEMRMAEKYISDPNLLNFHYGEQKSWTETKQSFFESHGSMAFFGRVVQKLEACRVIVHNRFVAQCSAWVATMNDDSVVWIRLLDPRRCGGFNASRRSSCHWNSEDERVQAQQRLKEEVKKLAMPELSMAQTENVVKTPAPDPAVAASPIWAKNDVTVVASGGGVPTLQELTVLRILEDELNAEIDSYLVDMSHSWTTTGEMQDAYQWWRLFRHKYPNVARAARKWLALTTTSTPNNRVMNICEELNSVRRPEERASVEKQVFFYNNFELSRH